VEAFRAFVPEREEIEGLDWPCPHCGITVRLRVLKAVESEDPLEPGYFLICKCPRKECGKVVFAEYENLNSRIDVAYPFPNASAATFPDSIPLRIREDVAEALRCYYAKAYRSVVVMCRRALQDIALGKKVEAVELPGQIRAMRTTGLITESLFNASHEIRHFGGFGAHPQDDGLDQVSRADADIVFEFVSQMLTHIYIMPAKTKELARKRQQAQQAKRQA
jgi:hypothetical protein